MLQQDGSLCFYKTCFNLGLLSFAQNIQRLPSSAIKCLNSRPYKDNIDPDTHMNSPNYEHIETPYQRAYSTCFIESKNPLNVSGLPFVLCVQLTRHPAKWCFIFISCFMLRLHHKTLSAKTV